MKQYKTLFGPVPSRRLGLSLGIDFFQKKICSLNCVYCEVGPTVQLTAQPDAFIPPETIIEECEDFFNSGNTTDYLTICGSGEPTLSNDLGFLISELKKRYPSKKVAVITNGTLLHIPEVMDQILLADLIMPSLDAVSKDTFEKINKPDSALNPQVMIKSITDLRKRFKGEIWLEILLLRGYNDHEEEIKLFIEAVDTIKPARVQFNTLVRPGVLKNIEALSKAELESIASRFNKTYHPEVITPSNFETKPLTSNQVFSALQRRPCSLADITGMVGSRENALSLLEVFAEKKILKKRDGSNNTYYSISRLSKLN